MSSPSESVDRVTGGLPRARCCVPRGCAAPYRIGSATAPESRVGGRRGRASSCMPARSLGIVGESGCGKSTLARMLVGLERPDGGTLTYRGDDVTRGRRAATARLLRQGVQMIFQDPYTSLDPRMTVGDTDRRAAGGHPAPGPPRRRREPCGRTAGPGGARAGHGSAATRTSSPAGSGSGSASPARWPSTPTCWSATSRCRRWTSRCRRRSSTCSADLQAPARRGDPLHRPRPLGGPAPRRPGRRDVPRPAGRGGSDRTGSTRTRPIRTPGPCCRPPPPSAPPNAAGWPAGVMLRGEPPSPVDPPTGCRFHPRCPMAQDICAAEVPVLRVPTRDPDDGRVSACHFADEVVSTS